MREMLVNKRSETKDLGYSIYSINNEDLEIWVKIGAASVRIPSDYFYDVLEMVHSMELDIDQILEEDDDE